MQTNPDGAIVLSREDLYDRAWTTPIAHLAEELGLSGTGLERTCWRHRVPVAATELRRLAATP